MSYFSAHKELYLLRHGQSTANLEGVLAGFTDVPLTPLGHEQAALASARLQALLLESASRSAGQGGALLDGILTSDLKRAVQTAEPVATALGIAPIASEGLRELYLGRWENLSFKAIEADEPELSALWLKTGMSAGFVYPEGESLEHVLARALPLVEAYLNEPTCKRLLVVAHGGTLSALISHYVFGSLDHAKALYLENASVSRILFHGSGASLNLLNY